MKEIVSRFVRGESIFDVSKQFNHPPYFLARLLVEHMTSLTSANQIRDYLRLPTDALSNSVLLEDYKEVDLVSAVDQARELDPMHGP